MCEDRSLTKVRVWIPPDLDCGGRGKWKEAGIDSCIASLVEAIQKGGINMRGSCCGHGKTPGDIHLEDGRILLILDKSRADKYLKNRQRQLKRWIGSDWEAAN